MVAVHLNERVLPLRQALRAGEVMLSLRRVFVLVLQDDAGHAGLGEAAPLPAFGGEDPISCQEALQAALPELPALVTRWLQRDRPDAGLGSLERRLAATPCARCCIETALLDLYAQRQGRPLADVLRQTIDDEPCLRSLPVNALLSGGRQSDLGEIASSLVADGWRTFKLKVGDDPLAAADLVGSLRDHVGRAVAIRVDANGAWDLAGAQRFCRETAGLDLEYIEQPTPGDDLETLAAVTRATRTRIAADESIRLPGDIGRLASLEAADVVILKPMALGGWRPTRQACELARRLGLGVVLTSFLDGSVGRAFATHCAAALSCCDFAQGLATGALLETDLTDEPLRARNGQITIGEEPGLGIGTLLPETTP